MLGLGSRRLAKMPPKFDTTTRERKQAKPRYRPERSTPTPARDQAWHSKHQAAERKREMRGSRAGVAGRVGIGRWKNAPPRALLAQYEQEFGEAVRAASSKLAREAEKRRADAKVSDAKTSDAKATRRLAERGPDHRKTTPPRATPPRTTPCQPRHRARAATVRT